MGFRILSVVLIGLLFAGHLAVGQTAPATQPSVADALPPGWEEIDQRLVFFTVQLASAETSLDAVNKAMMSAGYNQSSKQQQAQQYRQGNALMDRNAGGPVGWKDFYGKTAERFFYRPNFAVTVTKSRDQHRSSPDDLSQRNAVGPPSLRPPQFDYIYRANLNAERDADADVARLGGKIDALIARRRQLEAEQTSIWAKIAFQAVASRKLNSRPIYQFDLKIDGDDDLSKQRQDALRSGASYVRTVLRAISDAEELVDNDPGATFDTLQPVIGDATAKLDDQLIHSPKLALETSDESTSLGKLVASANRLADVAKNFRDSYHGALESDKAGDDTQKQTLRAYMQQSLFDCATNISTCAEFVSVLSNEWKADVDVEHPVATTGPSAFAALAKNSASASNSGTPSAAGGDEVTAANAAVREETADCIITGTNFKHGVFNNGLKIFSNRDYLMHNIPQKFQGGWFTQTINGVLPEINVQAKRDMNLYVATPERNPLDPKDWTPDQNMSFEFTTKKRNSMVVYEKHLAAGEKITMPQGSSSAVIVLVPPENSK